MRTFEKFPEGDFNMSKRVAAVLMKYFGFCSVAF
jgi:hypothetical protein